MRSIFSPSDLRVGEDISESIVQMALALEKTIEGGGGVIISGDDTSRICHSMQHIILGNFGRLIRCLFFFLCLH